MTAFVELNGISIRQKDFVLQVPRLSLYANRLYLLKGENGAGKSTLLRLLALLQKPQAGQMWVAGQPFSWTIRELKQLRRRITLLEQTPFLFRGDVQANLAFGLKVRGITGKKLEQRIAEALEIVGLQNFTHRATDELSGGELRRVALARALCLHPQLLLLDEPTASLDANQIVSFEKFLSRLPEQGIAVVIASHDNEQPLRLGGEIIRVKAGAVQQTVSAEKTPDFRKVQETIPRDLAGPPAS